MALCGFVNLLKPPGMTSHDLVQVVRRTLSQKAVGHTGTLDPAAAGVLVMALGPATRLTELVEAADKAYRAQITLGVTTDTLDAEGQIAGQQSAAAVTETALREVLTGLTGEIEMRPPAHSAISVGGRRLYDRVRAGEAVEAPLRRVTVHECSLRQFAPGEQATALVDVTCSKGTYVRSLAGMIGERLGCGAYLSLLLRTRVGSHMIGQAVTLAELAADPAACLIPVAVALPEVPQMRVDAAGAVLLREGRTLPGPHGMAAGRMLVLDEAGDVVCLAEARQGGIVQPRKVFPVPEDRGR